MAKFFIATRVQIANDHVAKGQENTHLALLSYENFDVEDLKESFKAS